MGNAYFADIGGMLGSFESGPVCLLIGACASLAVIVERPTGASSNSAAKNPKNKFDQSGVLHNRVVDEYFSVHKTFELGNFHAFLEKNKTRYGVKELPPIGVFANAIHTYGDRSVSNDVIAGRIDAVLKTAGIKKDIAAHLTKLLPAPSIQELNDKILRIEDAELKNLSGVQLEMMSMFFSVLRHSVLYSI
jgi:hypothetical protein